jgi:hypothetical protein
MLRVSFIFNNYLILLLIHLSLTRMGSIPPIHKCPSSVFINGYVAGRIKIPRLLQLGPHPLKHIAFILSLCGHDEKSRKEQAGDKAFPKNGYGVFS